MRRTRDLLAILKRSVYFLLIICCSGHIRMTLSVIKFRCSDNTLVPTTYSGVCACPGGTHLPIYCSAGTLYCSSFSTNPVIPASQLCDGTPNCSDGGDERCGPPTTTPTTINALETTTPVPTTINAMETTAPGTVTSNAGTVNNAGTGTSNAAQTMKIASTTSKNTVPSTQTMKFVSTSSKNTVPNNAGDTNTAIAIITTTDSKTTSSRKTRNVFQWHQSYLLTVSVMCTGVILTMANFFTAVSSGMANLPIQQQRMMQIRFPLRYQMIQRRIPLKYRLRPERFIRRRYVPRRQFFNKRRIFFQIPFEQPFYM